mgnify:CR=1 FL=1
MSSITYHVQSQGLTGPGATLSEIAVGLTYVDTLNAYSAEQWFILTAAEPTASWTFDPGPAVDGTLFYHGMLVPQAGAATSFGMAVAAGAGSPIVVGANVSLPLTLSIVPVQIDWSRVSEAEVQVNGQSFRFSPNDTVARYLPLSADSYDWSLVYTLNEGQTFSVQATGATAPALLLPPVPPLATIAFSVDQAYFDCLPIDHITVTPTNPGGQPPQIILTASQPGPTGVEIFETQQGSAWTLLYDYTYTVHYTQDSGLSSYTAIVTGERNSTVVLSEMGVRIFDVAPAMAPVLGSISINYSYGATTKTTQAPVTLQITNGDYQAGPFSYAVTYTLSGSIEPEAAPQTGSYALPAQVPPLPRVTLNGNPFTVKTTTVTASGLTASQRFNLTLFSTENGNLGLPGNSQWTMNGANKPVILTRAAPSQSYTFAAISPDLAALSFAGSLIDQTVGAFTNAISANSSLHLASHAIPYSITVNPTLVDWKTVDSVTLTLCNEAHPTESSTMTFTPASGFEYATYPVARPGSVPTISYCAVYSLSDGTRRTEKQTSVPAPATLMLPATGSLTGDQC